MPQGPSQPILSQKARLPLAKFSHTVTPVNHGGTLSWIHVNGRGGLVCELDKFAPSTAQPSRLILRVLNSRGILEQLDLEHFVRITAAQSRAVSGTSPSKPPFAVVVKSPCLAVRYAQNETHVRRFQIKFSQEQDYYTALAILSEINCPLTEGTTPPVHPLQRLPSSSSWTLAPSLQLTTTTATNVHNARTPDSNVVGLYPMSGAMSDVMTISRHPSSSSSIIHPLVSGGGQTASVPRPIVPNLDPTYAHHTMAAPVSRSESMASQRTDTRPIPVTAYHDERELNQMLPPKRELPFAKGSQGKSRGNKSDAKSAESRQPQMPLTSKPAETLAAYPTVENNASEHHELFIPDSQQSHPLTQTQPPAHSSQLSPQSSQLQPQPWQDEGPQSKQPVTSTEQTVSSPEGYRNNTNTNTQPQQTRQHEPDAARLSVEEQLALYGSAPTQERITFLENWMCELIEDDRFMALCQDVEATWRRFAFGMQR